MVRFEQGYSDARLCWAPEQIKSLLRLLPDIEKVGVKPSARRRFLAVSRALALRAQPIQNKLSAMQYNSQPRAKAVLNYPKAREEATTALRKELANRTLSSQERILKVLLVTRGDWQKDSAI